MTAVAADANAKPRPRKRKAIEVLRAIGQPKVGVMLALGFSSGLPFQMIGNTLGAWLATDHIKLAAIGFFDLGGPRLFCGNSFGARSSIMFEAPVLRSPRSTPRLDDLVTQVGVAVGLVGMAFAGSEVATDPGGLRHNCRDIGREPGHGH